MIANTVLDPDTVADPDLHADGDPHELWRWMREHSPVHHHDAGELPAFWSVTRHADVRTVYRDPATFSSAQGVLLRPAAQSADPGGGMTLALSDPPRHKQLRSLVAGWFTERTARGISDAVRSSVRAALDRAYEQGRCEFVRDVAGRLSIYVICTLLGVPESDHESVFRWTDEAYAAHVPLVSQHELMDLFGELMYRRMEEPADDMLSALANGTIDGELLTEREILLNYENLVGATENGRLAVAGGVLALARRPGEWARLRAEPDLVPRAVEEILRWTSSAVHSMRTATRDTELAGRRIAAGDRVVLWVPSANRDDAVFDDPFRFDVARPTNHHLALGVGEHFCLGATIARTQMRVLLGEMLSDLTAIVTDGPVEMVRSNAVSGPESLPLHMTRG